jgi:hypothetical protein
VASVVARVTQATNLSGATAATAALGQPEADSAACSCDLPVDPYSAEDGKGNAASHNGQRRGKKNDDNALRPHLPVVALELHHVGAETTNSEGSRGGTLEPPFPPFGSLPNVLTGSKFQTHLQLGRAWKKLATVSAPAVFAVWATTAPAHFITATARHMVTAAVLLDGVFTLGAPAGVTPEPQAVAYCRKHALA